MSRRLHNSVRIALLVALTTLGAFAEDRYLVKVNGDVNAVAKRYGLTVVKSLNGSGYGRHVLSSKGALPLAVLRNLSTEFAVRSAEAEKSVRLPGIKPAAAVHPSGAPA